MTDAAILLMFRARSLIFKKLAISLYLYLKRKYAFVIPYSSKFNAKNKHLNF